MSAFSSPFRFHLISLTVAAVAAAATLGTTTAMLLPPAMFLGWVAFSLAAPSLRGGFANLVSFEVGLVFGIGTAIVIARLTPTLDMLATPAAVAGVVVLVLSLRRFAPFDNPLAYFLGLTSFFYSGLAPDAASFALLAAAGAIGAASSALAGHLERWMTNGSPARSSSGLPVSH